MKLGVKYEVKTMKEINHILNIKVEKVKEEIKISQKAYTT